MFKRLLSLLTLLPAVLLHANELTTLQSATIAAQIDANPFVASLVRQGLVDCPAGGDSAQENSRFVACMNSYVFTQVSRWGICAKRFPTLDARVLQPCIDDQNRAHKLALASVTHVSPEQFNQCATQALYEPSVETISAFYLELGKQMIQLGFRTNAGNSFLLALGPFDTEKMLSCVAN